MNLSNYEVSQLEVFKNASLELLRLMGGDTFKSSIVLIGSILSGIVGLIDGLFVLELFKLLLEIDSMLFVNSRLINSFPKSMVFSTPLILLANGLNFLILIEIVHSNPFFGGIKHLIKLHLVKFL